MYTQEDDGLVLFESRAIARYIATKTGSPLAPTGDARAVAHFEQAAAIEACEFTPLAQGIAVQRHFNPAFGKPCDEARVEELAGDLAAKMAGYNRLLAKSRYLAGDEVTLADLFHLAYGVHLAPHGFSFLEDEEKFPHVARCV
jgi:glutathione S-transferase